MSIPTDAVFVGQLVMDDEWTLDEVCSLCAVEREWMVELAAQGVLEMRGADAAQTPGHGAAPLRFGGDVLRRVSLAARLRRDLGVNAAGVALTLELLGRIEELERKLAQGQR